MTARIVRTRAATDTFVHNFDHAQGQPGHGPRVTVRAHPPKRTLHDVVENLLHPPAHPRHRPRHRRRRRSLRLPPGHGRDAGVRHRPHARRRVAARQQERHRRLPRRVRRLHDGHARADRLRQQVAVRAHRRPPGRQGPDALERHRRAVLPERARRQEADHARAAVLAHQRPARHRQPVHVEPADHAGRLRQHHPGEFDADRHPRHGLRLRRQLDAGRRPHGGDRRWQGVGRHLHRTDRHATGPHPDRLRLRLHRRRLRAHGQSAHRRRRPQHAGRLRPRRRHAAGERPLRQHGVPVARHAGRDVDRSHRGHAEPVAPAVHRRLRLRHRPLDRQRERSERNRAGHLQPGRLRLHAVGGLRQRRGGRAAGEGPALQAGAGHRRDPRHGQCRDHAFGRPVHGGAVGRTAGRDEDRAGDARVSAPCPRTRDEPPSQMDGVRRRPCRSRRGRLRPPRAPHPRCGCPHSTGRVP